VTSVGFARGFSKRHSWIFEDAVEALGGEEGRNAGEGAVVNPGGGWLPERGEIVNGSVPIEQVVGVEDGIGLVGEGAPGEKASFVPGTGSSLLM
jgi:hypothetical protein